MIHGKAKTACFNWAKKKGFDLWKPKDYPLDVAKSIHNAIVIEWLDFIKIYVNISAIPFTENFRVEIRGFDNTFLSSCSYEAFKSRQEATEKAIEKSVEIYNEQNQ